MKRIERICAFLESAYGRPECHPKHGPLDELILTVLSQNTSSINTGRAFAGLRHRFESWQEARLASVGDIEEAIRVGGLAATKAVRIKKILQRVYEIDQGLTLDCLESVNDEDAIAFLREFEGVGAKTAACVLMFSLRRPVFPVDTHVHRIVRRLGLVHPKVDADRAHEILRTMIPPDSVYSLHVNMVTHGRSVCRARNPSCGTCVLREMCPSRQDVVSTGDDVGVA